MAILAKFLPICFTKLVRKDSNFSNSKPENFADLSDFLVRRVVVTGLETCSECIDSCSEMSLDDDSESISSHGLVAFADDIYDVDVVL